MNVFEKLYPVEFYKRFLEKNIRPDGRGFHHMRSLEIRRGSISTSDGSALVRLGNTTIICGIRGEIVSFKTDVRSTETSNNQMNSSSSSPMITLNTIGASTHHSNHLITHHNDIDDSDDHLIDVDYHKTNHDHDFIKSHIIDKYEKMHHDIDFDLNDERMLYVNIEVLPLCSSNIRTSKPNETIRTLNRFINKVTKNIIHKQRLQVETIFRQTSSASSKSKNGYDENQTKDFISLKTMSIGMKLYWVLYADLYCLDMDGNLLDASLIAINAALLDVKLPPLALTSDGQIEVFITPNQTQPQFKLISLDHIPISLSYAIYSSSIILVDPTSKEETLCDNQLSIVTNSNNQLVSIWRRSGIKFESDILKQCIIQSIQFTRSIREFIRSNRINHQKQSSMLTLSKLNE